MKENTNFRLQKWYLDCVNEKGQAFIGYSANLKWKSIGISYSSYLDFDGDRSKVRTSLQNERLPVPTERSIIWEPKKLSCSGNWQNKGIKPPKLQLFKDENGSVVWDAQFPLSKVEVNSLESGSQLNGFGYAEKLDLTIPPWKLPIENLIWGRFVSRGVYIVWIEWRGPKPLTVVYCNGEKIERASISKAGVYWKGGAVQHKESSVIREGPLVKTALKKIPGVKTIFPKKIINMYECKWLSKSKVSLNGTTQWGWTIHETVQF